MTDPHPADLDPALGHPPAEGLSDTADLLAAIRPYTEAKDGIAWRQVAVTGGLLALTLAAVRVLGAQPATWLLAVPLVGLFVRLFALQHDCGHLSLFRRRETNDRVGQAIAFVTGVAYHAWRSEHNWHHAHQGKLDRRGIDRMNSPMTRDEAIADPAAAGLRAGKISVASVFVLGAFSLVVQRKRPDAFFQFRPKFRWPFPDRAQSVKSVHVTNAGHVLFHLALIAAVGPVLWAGLVLPAMLASAGIGSLLFWVQHNFERTYHAPESGWRYVDAALQGSSYLKLPALLAWCSADIGIHHVHHLHARVPNYRLEEARRALPAVAAVQPLDGADLRRCFTHVYWDGAAGRMIDPWALDDAPPAVRPPAGAA